MRARHVALGADVRGIDLDTDLLSRIDTVNGLVPNARYSEDLDTRYYGAYVAWGGGYSPFILRGLWDRLGLYSTFQLRGGVYYADTDYTGRQTDLVGNIGNVSLSLSNDEVAFIGGIVLETGKKIGARTTLSLRSEYEYYSYVPEMLYNQTDRGAGGAGIDLVGRDGTSIGDDDAFSARTMLRLTVSLGGGHEAPLK